jgi:hypothetical protein
MEAGMLEPGTLIDVDDRYVYLTIGRPLNERFDDEGVTEALQLDTSSPDVGMRSLTMWFSIERPSHRCLWRNTCS